MPMNGATLPPHKLAAKSSQPDTAAPKPASQVPIQGSKAALEPGPGTDLVSAIPKRRGRPPGSGRGNGRGNARGAGRSSGDSAGRSTGGRSRGRGRGRGRGRASSKSVSEGSSKSRSDEEDASSSDDSSRVLGSEEEGSEGGSDTPFAQQGPGRGRGRGRGRARGRGRGRGRGRSAAASGTPVGPLLAYPEPGVTGAEAVARRVSHLPPPALTTQGSSSNALMAYSSLVQLIYLDRSA